MSGKYCGPIRLVIFDVDGVLTDGQLYIDGQGEAFKAFNVRDGLSVSLLKAHGIKAGVLSGKTSSSLDFRIQQLKFDFAVTGKLEKKSAYEKVKADLGLEDYQIAYVGDDVVDLPLAGVVGSFYAPSDSHPLVLQQATYVTTSKGGRGVAREVAEHILCLGGVDLENAYRPLINHWSEFNAVQ